MLSYWSRSKNTKGDCNALSPTPPKACCNGLILPPSQLVGTITWGIDQEMQNPLLNHALVSHLTGKHLRPQHLSPHNSLEKYWWANSATVPRTKNASFIHTIATEFSSGGQFYLWLSWIIDWLMGSMDSLQADMNSVLEPDWQTATRGA